MCDVIWIPQALSPEGPLSPRGVAGAGLGGRKTVAKFQHDIKATQNGLWLRRVQGG
jgi:hypothetical protein